MYKLAVCGSGGMGSWHIKNIQESIPEIEVIGAFDIREEALEDLTAKGLITFKSLEALLASDADIITIATPNNFHKDLAISAMLAGKHVVCEKPVTMNARELIEIMAVSKETGKLFSVHQNRRWDKDYRIIKEIIQKDTLGKPYYIESRVLGSRRSLHGWRGHKINGGGMVYDWGVHLIDQMLCIVASPVISVDAHLFSIYSEEVDDNFKAFLRFENGTSALIEIATNCFINLPRWHMTCTDGTAIIDGWDCTGKMVKLQTDEVMQWDNEIVYTAAGPTRTMAPRPVSTTEQLELPEVETKWTDYYENIVGVLSGTAELIVKPEQSLRVMKVLDAIFESQEKGCGIRCLI
jgi:scyllo-inositol 2-dehydrogenase (NADP+)